MHVTSTLHNPNRTFFLLLLCLVMMTGCGMPHGKKNIPRYEKPRQQSGSTTGRTTRPQTNGPAQSLFDDAQISLQRGDYTQAELLLERALRVEPHNGLYWHSLARVKFQQGAHHLAVQFCLKAESLIASNYGLARKNWLLLEQAYRQMGDEKSANTVRLRHL